MLPIVLTVAVVLLLVVVLSALSGLGKRASFVCMVAAPLAFIGLVVLAARSI